MNYIISQCNSETVMDILPKISTVDELEMARLINEDVIHHVKNQITYCYGLPLDLVDWGVYTTYSLVMSYRSWWNCKIIEDKLVRDNVPITIFFEKDDTVFLDHLIKIGYPNIRLEVPMRYIPYVLGYTNCTIRMLDTAVTYQQLVQYRRFNILPSYDIKVGKNEMRGYKNLGSDLKKTCELYPSCYALIDKFPYLKKHLI